MEPQGNTAAQPALKPEVISAYEYAWKKLWKPFWILLLIGIIYFAINFSTSIIPLIGFIAGFLVSGPLGYGMSFAYLKAARGEKVEVEHIFSAFKNYGHSVLANFLTTIIMMVPAGVIVFFAWLMEDSGDDIVIPFFIVALLAMVVIIIIITCKLAFIPYLVTDRKMKAVEAIKTSWNMTNGYFWQVFLIGLLSIPIVIAGLVCLVVGVIISFMWISMAIASLYHAVDISRAAPTQRLPENTAPPVT